MGPRDEMISQTRLRASAGPIRPKNSADGCARSGWIAVPLSCRFRLGVSGSLLSTVIDLIWAPVRPRRSSRARMDASPPGGITSCDGFTAVHPHDARTLRISSESVPALRIG